MVYPNYTHSEVYISHSTGDTPAGLNFHLSLVDPAGNATGTYYLTLVREGYLVNVGTSHLYVSNITAWLEQQSSVTTNPVPLSLGIISFSIAVFIIFRKRKVK
jgi:hypothetical protein